MLGLILNIIIFQEELDVHVVVPDPFSASFMYFMYLKKGKREGNSQYVKIQREVVVPYLSSIIFTQTHPEPANTAEKPIMTPRWGIAGADRAAAGSDAAPIQVELLHN